MREVTEALLAVLAAGQRAALATVVRVSGSAPQRPGARLLLRADGIITGTVGGGALELAVLDALRDTLHSGESRLLAQDLSHDLAMCCGGRMEVFLELVEATPRLRVCGAGHVAKATAALARTVGFDVTVIDDREDLNTLERFEGCELVLRDPPAFLRRTPLEASDWLLIVTHDHALDEETLELALAQSPRYIGLVGSRRKVLRVFERLNARHSALDVSRVYGPVGLDIGAVGPQEIAVSIVSELVALRRSKSAPHLRTLPSTP